MRIPRVFDRPVLDATEPMRGMPYRVALLFVVFGRLAYPDAISNFSLFLNQAGIYQQQNAFGTFSYAYGYAAAKIAGQTTLYGFDGSFTPNPAQSQVTVSQSLDLYCIAPGNCTSNPPIYEEWYSDTANSTVSGGGAARAQIGYIGAQASAGGAAYYGQASADYGSEARFWDTISVSPVSIASGYLQVDATVHGQLAVGEDGNGPARNGFTPGVDATVALQYGVRSGQVGYFYDRIGFDAQANPYESLIPTGTDLRNGIPVHLQFPVSASGFDPQTGKWSFAPIWFYISLSATADCYLWPLYDDAGRCAADSLFQNTLQVTGLGLFDALGNPVPGVALTAASGYAYNGTGTVPETSSLLLVAGGLFTVAGGARLMRRGRHG